MLPHDTVTIRDLRNHGGQIIDKVSTGSPVIITRDGQPTAELRPLKRIAVPTRELVESWKRLPRIDATKLRADVESVIDQSL